MEEARRVLFEVSINDAIGRGSRQNPSIAEDQRNTAITSVASGFKGLAETHYGLDCYTTDWVNSGALGHMYMICICKENILEVIPM